MQPFVIVKLNVKMGVDVSLNCAAWAGSIRVREKGVGMIKIAVKIN